MIQIGNRESFAIEIDWLPRPPEISDFCEAVTWAKIWIYAGGQVLTANRQDDGTNREWIHWHGVSIAEWILENWNQILYYSKPPFPCDAPDAVRLMATIRTQIGRLPEDAAERLSEKKQIWWKHHSLRAGAQGGALPEVLFWSQGNEVSIAWSPEFEAYAKANAAFIPRSGQVRVSIKQLEDVFRRFLDVVRDRLYGEPENFRANKYEDGLNRLHSPRARLSELVDYLGLSIGSFAKVVGVSVRSLSQMEADGDLSDLIPKVKKKLGVPEEFFSPKFEGSIVDAMHQHVPLLALFRSVAPEVGDRGVAELYKTWARAQISKQPDQELLNLKAAVVIAAEDSAATDFQLGRDRAHRVLEFLKTDLTKPIDIERIIKDLRIQKFQCELVDPLIDAASIWARSGSPLIALNRTSFKAGRPWATRTTLAHELCHILFDTDEARQLGIASGPWAPPRLERIANAFAVVFLLPDRLLLNLTYDPATGAGFKKLMREFSVGARTAARRLQDVGKINESQAEDLIEAYSATPVGRA